MSIDLTRLSVKELLQLEAGVVAELRNRDLVRTNNKPLGDIAEQVVLLARGGRLEPNSAKSHDVTDATDRKLQVKAMGARSTGRSSKFSAFRSLDFDAAVFLVFAADSFELVMAREVAPGDIEATSRVSAHTNGRQPSLSQIRVLGIDVTEEMRSAYETLNNCHMQTRGIPVEQRVVPTNEHRTL